MKEYERIIVRIFAVVAIGIGVICAVGASGLIHPNNSHEEDSIYKITRYNRRSGGTVSERIATGSELNHENRIGGVILMIIGGLFFWGSKKGL